MGRKLADDVRLVGDTLGEVLCAIGGRDHFEHVERMRLTAKRAREATGDEAQAAREALCEEARSLSPEAAFDVVRAFTLYFQLVNQAEDVHRARTLRSWEREGREVPESFSAVLRELRATGVSTESVLESVEELHVRYVFTAHPTEARRRTTERLLEKVREVLEAGERLEMTPSLECERQHELRAVIEALFLHGVRRERPPEVLDEVHAGLWYCEHVLMDAVPQLARRFEAALDQAGMRPEGPLSLPVSFASWMGGDRDGNPHVTDAIMERTLYLHRSTALERYARDLASLGDALAATDRRISADAPVHRALARAEASVPELIPEVHRRNRGEPLRRLLAFMTERVRRTAQDLAGGYVSPDALIADAEAARETLSGVGAIALANGALLDFVVRVRCFGFHLMPLQVREDSRVHRRVLGELLSIAHFDELPEPARRDAVRRLGPPQQGAPLSEEAERLLSLFDLLPRLAARFGGAAVSSYILSMAEDTSDVLGVLRLLELRDFQGRLDLVPLLETRHALSRAGTLLEGLFEDTSYRAHLAARGDVQVLLLGYSDSMKESGMLASRVAVLAAQREAARVCAAHGVRLRVFHGRGGSVSRGGGPTYRAIGGLPRDAFSGELEITEQGEVRAHHFGHPELAARYLEQTVGAALLSRAEARQGIGYIGAGEESLLERLAAESRRAYLDLLERGAVAYFREASPFLHIADLNIASRPVRRSGGEPLTLANLRAIPWVFGWSQCRHVITGWYGVGTALEAVGGTDAGLVALRGLYRDSAYFRDVIDNVEMTLAKADLGIGARYAELCRDSSVREAVFSAVRAECHRTRAWVLSVTGADHLLAGDPVIRDSIDLRNPYVDPLSYVQVEAMRRERQGPEDAQTWFSVAQSAVHGIAAGLRNTG